MEHNKITYPPSMSRSSDSDSSSSYQSCEKRSDEPVPIRMPYSESHSSQASVTSCTQVISNSVSLNDSVLGSTSQGMQFQTEVNRQ